MLKYFSNDTILFGNKPFAAQSPNLRYEVLVPAAKRFSRRLFLFLRAGDGMRTHVWLAQWRVDCDCAAPHHYGVQVDTIQQ